MQLNYTGKWHHFCWKKKALNLLTSSLSSAWMKRGRANPTCASSVMRTRYSELLNFGALSFLSISRMVNVVITVASDGLRSSFNSVASVRKREQPLLIPQWGNLHDYTSKGAEKLQFWKPDGIGGEWCRKVQKRWNAEKIHLRTEPSARRLPFISWWSLRSKSWKETKDKDRN